MYRLSCAIQRYAWGSHTALAALQGRPTPSAEPEAELWMGAHPLAPSWLPAERRTLAEEIARAPLAALGRPTLERFGPALPFLLKILAVEQPLSLQVHPNAPQARAGFEREESAGIPLGAPYRTYRDRAHKPELLVAMTPFEALAGFRRVEDTLRLLRALEPPPLAWLREALTAGGAAALDHVVRRLFEAAVPERTAMVAAVVRGAERRAAGGGEHAAECAWILALAARYPEDAGVVIALLLNLIHLAPGQGLYISAGRLHAYLRGTACEVMASSDNVLRGGLTPKHVDVVELLRTVDFDAGPLPVLTPRALDGEVTYDTPAVEFRLSRVTVAAGGFAAHITGPEIWIAVDGALTLHGASAALPLARGEAAFLPAATEQVRVTGRGAAFRVTVPLA